MTIVSIRNEVTSRTPLTVQSYNTVIHGDSLSDGALEIGEALDLYTSQHYRLRRNATAGDKLTNIEADFTAEFPADNENTIILQGGTYDVVAGTAIATMKTEMASMVDAVIANRQNNLFIINVPPWMGHASWTTTLQALTEEYNTWLASTYPDYIVDVYTALGDPDEPRQLAGWYYQLNRTIIVPNDNAYRKIDELIGAKLYTRTVADLTEPTLNQIASYRDFSSWTFTTSDIGGNPVKLPDGTTGTVNGLLPTLDAAGQKAMKVTTIDNPDGASIRVIAYIRPGEREFAWMRFIDSANATDSIYLDLLNVALGAHTGTGIWTIEKSSNGWVKVTLLHTNGSGSIVNSIDIRSANTISSLPTDAYNRTTDMYPVEIFVDAVSIEDIT